MGRIFKMLQIEEIWKPIINYEGLYELSVFGKIKSLKSVKEKTLIPKKDKYGHLQVRLYKNGIVKQYSVHRLVLETFIGPRPEGMEGCHNDGNGSNNFLENLRYDTHENNMRDRIKHKTNNPGSKCNFSKLIESNISGIRKLHIEGKSDTEIAKIYGVGRMTINDIINNKTWKHVKEE
jgi:hypothetical protein